MAVPYQYIPVKKLGFAKPITIHFSLAGDMLFSNRGISIFIYKWKLFNTYLHRHRKRNHENLISALWGRFCLWNIIFWEVSRDWQSNQLTQYWCDKQKMSVFEIQSDSKATGTPQPIVYCLFQQQTIKMKVTSCLCISPVAWTITWVLAGGRE